MTATATTIPVGDAREGRLPPLRRLLRAALAAATAAAGLDARVFGWELRPTGPPADGRSWIEETLRPGPELQIANGPPRTLTAAGLYVLVVRTPTGEGTGALDAVCDAIDAAFSPGARLTASPVGTDVARLRVDVTSVDPSPAAGGGVAGWGARSMRVGFTTTRLVAADGSPETFRA